MSESFVFYESYYRAAKKLPEKERLEALEAIINYGLYQEEPEDDGFISVILELVKPGIDANATRRANGNKGGRPSKKPLVSEVETIGYESENHRFPNENHRFPTSKPYENENVYVNENETEHENVNVEEQKPKRTRFVPPTLEEVTAYAIEKGLAMDCERFVDFYGAKGWKVGSAPMKDWKAAARNWARQDKERRASAPAQPNRFSNFQQHGNDGAPSDLAMELFRRQQQLGRNK